MKELAGVLVDGFLEFELGGRGGWHVSDASCCSVVLCEAVH